jgi:hypothetical protein
MIGFIFIYVKNINMTATKTAITINITGNKTINAAITIARKSPFSGGFS